MEGKNTDPVSAFDSLFTTNKIQMLKVITSHLPPGQQPGFAVCIRLMELQYSLYLLQHPTEVPISPSGKLTTDFLSGENADTLELLDELIPYSNTEEQKHIQNIKNMLCNLTKMKDIMNMLDMLKELFPDGFGGDGNNSEDVLSLLSGLSGTDLSPLFEML